MNTYIENHAKLLRDNHTNSRNMETMQNDFLMANTLKSNMFNIQCCNDY